MSIARAIHEIEVADSLPASRYAVFRARQADLDRLIGDIEQLVMTNSTLSPAGLVARASRVLTAIDRRVPPWHSEHVSPVTLLDHLFAAEGRLRQQYYRRLVLDLNDDD